MVAVFLSILSLWLAPVPAAPAPVAQGAAPAGSGAFDWLDGTWRRTGLEMRCGETKQGMTCSEEGSGAMAGAKAELAFDTLGEKAVLEIALPSVPPSRFTEVARDTHSVTFEMPTKTGVARLRFTRSDNVLKVERGSAAGWANAMEYRRG